jgi:SAM-dependent methyltransferase
MMPAGRLRAVIDRIGDDGIGTTLRLAAGRLRSEVRSIIEDARRGVSTVGEVPDHALGFRNPQNHAYVATDYEMFRTAIASLKIGTDDVFVDIGSGKGRAVLLAAEHPFRRVIGVEISPLLHAIALRNVARARRRACLNVELVLTDATEWKVPDDVTVLFFFNPFDGAVLAKVCDNIRQSLTEAPRRITIIYVRADKFFEREIAWSEWLVRLHEFPYSDGKVAIYESMPTGASGHRVRLEPRPT